jgi:hypothetical protein
MGKIRKKMRDEVGGLMYTCPHMSKYSNFGNHEGKIAVKYAKNQKKMRDEVEGLMYTRSVRTFPNIVTLEIRDYKSSEFTKRLVYYPLIQGFFQRSNAEI